MSFIRRSWVLVFALACESAPSDEGTEGDPMTTGVPDGPCVPGQSIACGCGGGAMGAAQCSADGSGYGDCTCDGDPTSAGVSSQGVSSDDESGSDESSGSGEVSFERDIKPILLVSCGGMVDTCHSRAAYAANEGSGCRGWFSFEDAAIGSQIYAGPTAGDATNCPDMSLYDRLLQINSWQCDPDGRPVIEPGNPSASYMLMKIDGIDLCPDGALPSKTMPPPGEGFGLPASSRATIEEWILAGAPNN